MSSKRKRNAAGEDCDDCLPISKRINQLQIDSGSANVVRSEEDGMINNQAPNVNVSNGNPAQSQVQWNKSESSGSLNQAPVQQQSSVTPTESNESMSVYDPELNLNENPHYYEINALLYKAHVARHPNNQPPAAL